MKNIWDKIKLSLSSFKLNKKVFLTSLAFIVLVGSLAAGVYLTQQRQQTDSSAATATLSLQTNNANPRIGDSFTVAVSMNTQGFYVNGADLKIKYDPTKLTATAITPGAFLPKVIIGGTVTSGLASIVLSCPIDSTAGPSPVTGTGLVAQVSFRAIATGPSSVSIDPESIIAIQNQVTNALGPTTPITITVSATPAPTPTRTPTVAPTRTPTLAPTRTPTIAPTPTRTPTVVPTPTRTPTIAPTPTRTPTVVPTPTRTPTVAPTDTPTPTPRKPGDVNGDGLVNIVDIGMIVDYYNDPPPATPDVDLNNDGIINIIDIGIVIDNYTI